MTDEYKKEQCYFSIQGFSEKFGTETACEVSKKRIEQKIMGTAFPEENLEYDENDESDHRHIEAQRALLCEYETEEDTAVGAWLKEIEHECEIIVQEDDGDRDNIMLNPEFAAHFLRLCKLLPLWSGISCKVFGSPTITSSSANVESYFKDTKHVLKAIIPANTDVFLQNHMDSIDDSIITASQKYAKLINVNVAEKTSDLVEPEQLNDAIAHEDDSVLESQQLLERLSFEEEKCENNSMSEQNVTETLNEQSDKIDTSESSECIACSRGDLPTGAHTCIRCNKFVHILTGCSIAIDVKEGYGTKRMCISCHMENRKDSQSRDKKEMNIREEWGPKKSKQSVYLRPNPSFNLMSDTRKNKIGLLKNCHLSKTTKRIEGVPVYFSNSCTHDAIAQALAGAYAYNPNYRKEIPECDQSDPLLQISIALAKK